MIKRLLIISYLSLITTAYSEAKFYSGMSEREIVKLSCPGEIEVSLPNRAGRVDCMTDDSVVEYDFQHKWAEAIGQSLYYATKTNKDPAIMIICTDHNCDKQIEKLRAVISTYRLPIEVFVINIRHKQ